MEEPSGDLPRLRRAALADSRVILAQRRAMFAAQPGMTPAVLETLMAEYAPWLWSRLAAGEYLGWLATLPDSDGGERVAAGAGLWLIDWPPTVRNLSGKLPYILNVYTDPNFRRLGLGRQLVQAILQHCREQGYPFAFLHTSECARSLYDSLGFVPSSEMMIDLTAGEAAARERAFLMLETARSA